MEIFRDYDNFVLPPVTYRLVVQRDQNISGCDSYGVEIAMNGLFERENCLTSDFTEANIFLSILERCMVTPVSLHDIAEDWRRERELCGTWPG